MKKSSFICCLIGLIMVTGVASGQSARTSTDPDYKNEWLYGVNFNTSGGLLGGFMFKYARAINDRNYHAISLEMVNVKHPKEARKDTGLGTDYAFGKLNHYYSIRPLYGFERILFRKAKEQGVQVSAMLSAGPSLAIIAPYMVQLGSGRVVPYVPDTTPENEIVGTGGFLNGLSDSELRVGAGTKASLFFELGSGDSNVAGFEVGFSMDYFSKEIIILPEAKNYNLYTAGFISLFYGIRN